MINVKRTKTSILSVAFKGILCNREGKHARNEEIAEIHKKNKKYVPVTDDEKLIDVPEHWVWTRLGYVTENHGQTTPTETFSYIDVGTMDNVNQRLSKHENLVEAKDAPSRAKKIVEKGDVLYSTVRPYLHNICIVDKDFTKKPIASTAFCVMAANEKVLNNKFLFYWLLTAEFDRFSNGNPSKGTLYPAIGEKDLLNGVIPLPPLKEQKEIVEIIEDAFNALGQLDVAQSQYASDLEVLKSKLIGAAICGKLTEQLPEDGDAEDLYNQIQDEKAKLIKEGKIKKEKHLHEITEDKIPFEIPDNWKWVRWGDLSESIQYGYNAPAKEFGRIKMVRISDIHDNKVEWENVPYCDISEEDISNYLLCENDILFARTGGTVGKSFLVKNVTEDAIYAGYLIRTRYSKKLVPEYMKYFMESQLYWKQLNNGTIATAQPNCNGKTLAKMILPLPPVAEQKRIVDRLKELISYCKKD